MKYLKRYNESISEEDLRDNINDILLDLEDKNFSVKLFKDNEYGEDNYKIHIGTKENKNFYKWEDIKYPILHLFDFVESKGYFWSFKYYKPIRKPNIGKEPKVKDYILGWAKKHTFTSSKFDKMPEDGDYFCVANERGIVRGLDIVISLLGRR